MTQPFRILGLQPVATGALDRGLLRALWCDIFGSAIQGRFRSGREHVDDDLCTLGLGPHEGEVDLMQPINPSAMSVFHTTPLNHIGLWVDDLPKAVEWMSAHSVRFAPGGIRKGAAGHDICFIHRKANDEFAIAGDGVLIGFVQAPDDVIATLSFL